MGYTITNVSNLKRLLLANRISTRMKFKGLPQSWYYSNRHYFKCDNIDIMKRHIYVQNSEILVCPRGLIISGSATLIIQDAYIIFKKQYRCYVCLIQIRQCSVCGAAGLDPEPLPQGEHSFRSKAE